MIDDSSYRRDHFCYKEKFYPLEADRTYFSVVIRTTFGLQRTLIASAEADREYLKQHFDFSRLNGFVAFDLNASFDWMQLPHQSYDGALTDDDDVNIYTEMHEFAERQSLEILDRIDDRYLMKLGWILEDNRVTTAFGTFRFSGITVYANDKIFGARRRKLIEEFGDSIPVGAANQLDSDMCEFAWEQVENIDPQARSQYNDPTVSPGNKVHFTPRQTN